MTFRSFQSAPLPAVYNGNRRRPFYLLIAADGVSCRAWAIKCPRRGKRRSPLSRATSFSRAAVGGSPVVTIIKTVALSWQRTIPIVAQRNWCAIGENTYVVTEKASFLSVNPPPAQKNRRCSSTRFSSRSRSSSTGSADADAVEAATSRRTNASTSATDTNSGAIVVSGPQL